MFQSSNRYSLLRTSFLSGVFATTTLLSLVSSVQCRPVRAELQDSPKALVDEVWQIVNRRYADSTFNQVNWQATRQSLLSQEYTSREQAYTAIRETLKKLEDPYTRFLDPKQNQALNEQTISGETSGIGIQIKLDQKTQRLTIEKALENSPAFTAGIKAGDQILAIDGKPTNGMKLEDASKLIRGKVGTPVVLRIGRQQEQKTFDVKITRTNIELPKVSYTLKQEGSKRVGYIRLSEFSATAPKQMRKAIQDLNRQQVGGFVLDLRGNGGGLLVASVDIARMWLNHGAIAREVERTGGSTEFKANHTALTQKPLVVLVDGNSASASEILTGALRDNNRAVIVGSKTFGKALVQQLYSLSDGSGLTVTVGRYFTPKGTDINKIGIMPDVKIDLTDEQLRQLATNPALIGTQSDPQYARALAVLLNNSFTAKSSLHQPFIRLRKS
ncbi:carboxyl-terminal processing protease CtpB [Brasilonema sp. UFV-L1]|uniref:carboxyl-terminal processing protease CtpB n=1 Tax=Brasilonema sp. UFV-L1 TaxID=2234130 RepID=UPI00145F4717|nr:carboxyl-terminal processing protease CtpB [Brasilonema sp. UFV-L1]NMG08037.1 peptidase S41 [Brasilonema sp. UFV-L1]